MRHSQIPEKTRYFRLKPLNLLRKHLEKQDMCCISFHVLRFGVYWPKQRT